MIVLFECIQLVLDQLYNTYILCFLCRLECDEICKMEERNRYTHTKYVCTYVRMYVDNV